MMGIPVYTADVEAKRLMESSAGIRVSLEGRFGACLYAGGCLDKSLLARLIFENEENLCFVNSVVHPVVFEDFRIWTADKIHFPIVVAESAILFESGFYCHVDYTVNVLSPFESRIERIMKRDGSTREEVIKRVNSQLLDDERNCMADRTIVNDGQSALLPQVESLVEDLIRER
jgi:dephospho-CoA kinase